MATIPLLLSGLLAGSGGCATDNGSAPGRICTPGNFVFCRCQNREEGTKLCGPDGMSFAACGPCEGEGDGAGDDPGAATELDAGAESDRASLRDAAPFCGDGNVDTEEVCDSAGAGPSSGCDSSCLPTGNPPAGGAYPGQAVHAWTKPISFAGSTAGYANGNSNGGSRACANLGKGPAHIYSVTAHASGLMAISTKNCTFDNALFVRSDCGDSLSEIACIDDSTTGAGETLVFPVKTGKTYCVFVAGYNGLKGDFTLDAVIK